MSLSASIKLSVSGSLSNAIDIGSAGYSFNKTYTNNFANGTGANQANNIWTDSRSVNASSNDDLDLAGSLTNAFGATLTFTNVKAIIIKSDADNGDDLEVGAEGSADFATFFGDASDKIIVPPGGMFCLTNPGADGFGVTATTGDILRIANTDSGGSATYEIIVIGETS
jgi:hypothetical protein